jgi:hypothetical protein
MSANFPVSSAVQTALAGSKNAFVTKLNPSGVLVYSTYLGGSGSDSGNAIAVDSSDSVTVVGDATSANFPLLHPIQPSLHGQTNVFVTRLGPNGNALVYSTYLGGSGSDHGAGVALDSTGAAYLTGSTTSINFPAVNAFQGASGGNQDAFVAKIDSAGDSLVYSTYLGGSGGTVGYPEAGAAIAVDGAGDAYVTGTTSSPNFPLENALFSTSAGVGIHAFVTELNSTGSGLVYSTYLGGSSFDQAMGIAVDSGGNAVVAGLTASSDFPLADPTQASQAGSYDAFVTRLNSTGTALVESTYFGGSGSDAANAVAYDTYGVVYLVGQTQSFNLPIENATQTALAGTQNAFLAVFSPPEPPAPAAPTGLTATAGNASVPLSWVASSGASTYSVYRGTSAGGESTTAIASGITATSYSNTGLTNGTQYYYKVAAVNAGGTSPLSAEASATPEPPQPAAPTGLTAGSLTTDIPVNDPSFEGLACGTTPGAIAQNCVPTGWSVTGTADATLPPIGAWDGIPDGSQVAWSNGGTLTQILSTTVAPGTTYTLSVWVSERKNPANTFSPDIQLLAGSTPLITWTTSAPGGALPTKNGDGTYTWVDWTGTYTSPNSGSVIGQALEISLGADSAQSDFDDVTLTATPNANTVALSWTASSGATSYNVYRGTSAGGESATAIATDITATSCSNTGLVNGTQYYYKVAAVNAGGTSPLSAEASATP